ncbi:hypothetical protein OSTOST_01570, partial [Ostertagia ostertagi]
MMDTGADQSFITRNYADHLGLGKTGQLQLTIHTFGNSSPTEQSCETTQVEIEDRQGVRHSFELAKIDFITGDVKRTELHREDRQYLQDHDIQLSISPQIQTLQTPILLGCGDLFTLFDQGLGQKHSLPSGMKLVYSKIGYLIATGKRVEARTVKHGDLKKRAQVVLQLQDVGPPSISNNLCCSFRSD